MQSETGIPVLRHRCCNRRLRRALRVGFAIGGSRISLALRELRHRYARSKLGQFWLTLIYCQHDWHLAAVWSLLWNQPIHELAPFIGVSLIIWNYLSQVLIDCTTVFSNQANLYLKSEDEFFSVDLFRDLQEYDYACS